MPVLLFIRQTPLLQCLSQTGRQAGGTPPPGQTQLPALSQLPWQLCGVQAVWHVPGFSHLQVNLPFSTVHLNFGGHTSGHTLHSGGRSLRSLQKHSSCPSTTPQILPSKAHTALASGPQRGSVQLGRLFFASLHFLEDNL